MPLPATQVTAEGGSGGEEVTREDGGAGKGGGVGAGEGDGVGGGGERRGEGGGDKCPRSPS